MRRRSISFSSLQPTIGWRTNLFVASGFADVLFMFIFFWSLSLLFKNKLLLILIKSPFFFIFFFFMMFHFFALFFVFFVFLLFFFFLILFFFFTSFEMIWRLCFYWTLLLLFAFFSWYINIFHIFFRNKKINVINAFILK